MSPNVDDLLYGWIASLFSVLSCALYHTSNAFALAQVVRQNRVAFDTLFLRFPFSSFPISLSPFLATSETHDSVTDRRCRISNSKHDRKHANVRAWFVQLSPEKPSYTLIRQPPSTQSGCGEVFQVSCQSFSVRLAPKVAHSGKCTSHRWLEWHLRALFCTRSASATCHGACRWGEGGSCRSLGGARCSEGQAVYASPLTPPSPAVASIRKNTRKRSQEQSHEDVQQRTGIVTEGVLTGSFFFSCEITRLD